MTGKIHSGFGDAARLSGIIAVLKLFRLREISSLRPALKLNLSEVL
jgi:hypothetical protein